MQSDDTPFSISAVWSYLYSELHGSPWEDEDIDNAMHGKNPDSLAAALTLRHVYNLEWKGVESEDGVLATLKAARQMYGSMFLTPGQVKEMARHFAVHYPDRLTPMEDYLDEHCGPVRWHWLNDHGRQQIEQAVVKDSEIWVTEVNVSDDVWIFNRPGRR